MDRWGAAVFVVLVVLAVGALARRRDAFGAAPYNLQLYDVPYFYPHVPGLEMASWDGDKRCYVNCSVPPCTMWCK